MKKALCAVASALIAGPAIGFGEVRAETVFVNDALTGPPQGAVAGVGVGESGGSHGPEGWTTTGPADTIWYTLPGPIPRGSVEVTLTGASGSSKNSKGADASTRNPAEETAGCACTSMAFK